MVGPESAISGAGDEQLVMKSRVRVRRGRGGMGAFGIRDSGFGIRDSAE
jgi:hypothetical protein